MNPDELIPPHLKENRPEQSREAAVNVIRDKLQALYADEPEAKLEAAEVSQIHGRMSKHQKFMKQLTDSGKDAAEIQTAWHNYYQALSEVEKHEVWQEFYQKQAEQKKDRPPSVPEEKPATPIMHRQEAERANKRPTRRSSPVAAHKTRSKKRKHQIRSLIFGLSMGFTVVFVLLFGFFNERFIVPFIRPSQNVSATPIIVDPNSTGPVGPESKIIIPKINVEAPVVYDAKSIEEKDIQEALENGVVHYPTTPNPGEKGNAVIFGHSSGNILNKGKYKFAFILLRSLENGDTFIVQKDGKRYVYKIYNKYVTSPTDLSVLGPTNRDSIMTLITCDPPGTSTNRLIIQAEQIFPDPAANTASSVQPTAATTQPEQLPSNSPTLWQRIVGWF